MPSRTSSCQNSKSNADRLSRQRLQSEITYEFKCKSYDFSHATKFVTMAVGQAQPQPPFNIFAYVLHPTMFVIVTVMVGPPWMERHLTSHSTMLMMI